MALKSSSADHRASSNPTAQRITLAAILLLSLSLNAVPVWWGLPSVNQRTWAFDEIPPGDDGLTLESRHQGRYPPLHYHFLRGVYWPVRKLAATGVLDLGETKLRTVLQLVGRLLSVVLATATTYLVYRIGRLLLRPTGALLAALSTSLVVPFVFYAKTINLEAPYVFWFSLSLLFFVRLQLQHRLGDYLGFGAAMVGAVCTKDQAFALYLLSPLILVSDLHRHRRSEGDSGGSILRTLCDRRLVAGALLATVSFVLIHNVVLDWPAFARHIRIITGKASVPSQVFEPTLTGQIAMLLQAVRHLAFSLGWPLLAAAGVGVGLAIQDRNRKLLSLLVFPISYYLFFIVPILYHRVRFFVPVCIVLSFFAARALDELLDLRGRGSWFGRTAVTGIFLFTLLRPLSLDQEMLFDSRYRVESWLQTNAGDERVTIIGTHRPRLPRRTGFRRLSVAAEKSVSFLRNLDAEYLVVNEEEAITPIQKNFMTSLVSGNLNYGVLFRHRYEPWPFRLDRSGLSTNLVTVNPTITVLKKSHAWGLPDDQVFGALMALKAGRYSGEWAAVADAIALAGPSEGRQGLGTDMVTFGLSSDGWTRGTSRAAIVFDNQRESPLHPSLDLSCGAPPGALPIKAFVMSGEDLVEIVFASRGRQSLDLAPVAPRSRRLYLVYTDREWSPGESDRRRLGVRIERGPERGSGSDIVQAE